MYLRYCMTYAPKTHITLYLFPSYNTNDSSAVSSTALSVMLLAQLPLCFILRNNNRHDGVFASIKVLNPNVVAKHCILYHILYWLQVVSYSNRPGNTLLRTGICCSPSSLFSFVSV